MRRWAYRREDYNGTRGRGSTAAWVEHLRGRADVQNIDLMHPAGFCRNCLVELDERREADAQGVAMTKDESREIVYGTPYDAMGARRTPLQERLRWTW